MKVMTYDQARVFVRTLFEGEENKIAAIDCDGDVRPFVKKAVQCFKMLRPDVICAREDMIRATSVELSALSEYVRKREGLEPVH
jgi:hypothetical protein